MLIGGIENRLKHLKRMIDEERKRLEELEDKLALQECLVKGMECSLAIMEADYPDIESLVSPCDRDLL